MTIGLIALGANLSFGGVPPSASIPAAMEAVAKRIGGPVKRSQLYRTPAFPTGSGPDYVNAAMVVQWSGDPEALLHLLHGVEEAFGRTRAARWEARVMDLDLIGLGAQILPDATTQAAWAALPPEEAARVVPDQLILPHPRLRDRAFVLVPLADVAPDWVDPASGLTIAEMLAACSADDIAAITPLLPADDGRD